jgi:hypothetical protein
MQAGRKTAETRENELRIALLRIKHGKARTGVTRVTILSVAREAGVSAALIHNNYPVIAEQIRLDQGRDSRSQRNAKHDQLKRERQKNRQLRAMISTLLADVQRLSTINEVLQAEKRALLEKVGEVTVVPLTRNSVARSSGR